MTRTVDDGNVSDHPTAQDIAVITNSPNATDDAFASTIAPAAAAPKSWIELRYVKRNGKVYGPYRYRRWREGGRLRSRYLGKAKTE
jgi:hypothetical protein